MIQNETSWKWNCPWEVVRILEQWEIFLSFQSPFGGIFFSQSCLSSVLPLMFTQIDLFCHQNWFYFKQEHFEGSIKPLFTFLSAEKTSRTSAFCPEPNFVGPCVGWVCLFFFFPLSFVPSRELKNKPFFPSASYPANNEPEGRVFPVFMNRKCSIFLLLMGL